MILSINGLYLYERYMRLRGRRGEKGRTWLNLELKNGNTLCIDNETTTLFCDEDCRSRLWVVLWVRVIVEVVESLFVVCFLL
jgi:hypothetical protein